jgi:hypothetical protein
VLRAVGGELLQQRREFSLDFNDLAGLAELGLELLGALFQPDNLFVTRVGALATG